MMKKYNYIETTFECQRDNLTIRGTEYRPAGHPLSTAIVSHGFMGTQDVVNPYAKALAEMGVLSYCFDFCGGSVSHGKSDGKTEEMSVLTEVQDLEAVIDYIQSKPYSTKELSLIGFSQGGFVSALCASRHPHLIQNLILVYPALCIPDDARKGRMMYAEFDPDHLPDMIQCGPMKLGQCYVQDVIHMDPYEEIKAYSGNVLLLHGSDDKLVSLNYSIKAHEIYSARNQGSIQFEIIEGAGHKFTKEEQESAIAIIKTYIENTSTK